MRMTKIVWTVALVCGAAMYALGQDAPLGDVARASRQKAQQNSPAAPKVITNDDIPESKNSTPAKDGASDSSLHDSSSEDKKTADEWKSEILEQKNQIDALERRIAQENSSIRFVEAARYSSAVVHNERQIQKQEDVQRMKGELENQKKALEDMQEAARQQGYGSSVYEP